MQQSVKAPCKPWAPRSPRIGSVFALRAPQAAAAMLASTAHLATAQGNPATSTFDKIKATGTVVLGVREASAPMAYALGANE
jgi:ABC-type amino acid transport substrate-binding protein